MRATNEAESMVDPGPFPAWTVGLIAQFASEELGESVTIANVDYLIRDRGIRPIMRAGHLKIFNQAAVDLILSELAAIRAERNGGAQ